MDPRTRVLVVGDSHIRRLRDFVEAPPDEFQGSVQLSMGLVDSSRLDLSFLGRGGGTVSSIEIEDMQEIERFAPHVVILMVGVTTSPARPHRHWVWQVAYTTWRCLSQLFRRV